MRTLLNAGLLRLRESFIEFEVQFEYVDSGFSKKAELAIFRMFCQQWTELVYGGSALFGYARQLEFCSAGLMCGSSPDAEPVTRSMGTGVRGFSA